MSTTRNLNAAIGLLLNLTAAAGKASALIGTARAEGRDVTAEELAGLQAADDAARGDLVAAIEAAKAGS
ncbi:MAG TPA: hypothetical protein VD932_03715 [Aquabacterium sp.]|nr:hypothetical protein [Aquabacterium sp.]